MTLLTMPRRMARCSYNGARGGVLNGVQASLKRYPAGLVFLYSPSSQGMVASSRLGPPPTYSYAGTQYNDQGVSIGAVPAWHDSRGVWVGPGYTNALPAGREDFTSLWTKLNTEILLTNGWYKISSIASATTSQNTLPGGVVGTSLTFSVIAKKGSGASDGNKFAIRDTTTTIMVVGFDVNFDNGVITYTAGTSGATAVSTEISGEWLVSVTVPWTTGNIPRVYCGFSGVAETAGEFAYFKNPMVVASPYQLPYIPPGTSVVSAAATSGGNGMSFALTAGMRECFERSVTDGVELWNDATVTVTNPANYLYDAATKKHTIWRDAVSPFINGGSVTAGNTYRLNLTFTNGGGGPTYAINPRFADGGTAIFTAIVNPTEGAKSYIFTALQTGVIKFALPNTGYSGAYSNISIQRLQPSVFTAAALCYMDASSAEITTDSNILAVNNNVTGGIYAASGGVLKAFDGTNAATVTVAGGWARGENLFVCWWINAAGTNQQIGYKKAAESAITWGAAAVYDGSANPGTHLRLAYNGDKPQHQSHIQLWNKSVGTDAEILSLLRYVP